MMHIELRLKTKGLSINMPWCLRRADAFMQHAGYSDPGDATREADESCLAELGR